MITLHLHELEAITRIGSLAQECINEDRFGQIMTAELLSLLNSVSGVFIEFEQCAEGVCSAFRHVLYRRPPLYEALYRLLSSSRPGTCAL